jgi:aminoglycoside phosphotransferase (APT) family kinase protein
VTDDLHQIRAYATHVVADCSADRIKDVQPFGMGENHAVYRLSYLDPDQQAKDVVVRIASSDRARDPAAAGREATALKKVGGFVAPLLHDFSCDSEWFDAPVMCMDLVEGVQRAPREAQEFERLGHSVGRVHEVPTQDLVEWLPDEPTTRGYLETRLAKIAEKRPWIRDPLPVTVQDRLRRALATVEEVVEEARRAESFTTNESLVLLHGDVAGGNIVWTPDPVLIDWEYARVGDPADEIAYIFAQHDCTPEQRTMFWRGYEQSRDRDRAREHVRANPCTGRRRRSTSLRVLAGPPRGHTPSLSLAVRRGARPLEDPVDWPCAHRGGCEHV